MKRKAAGGDAGGQGYEYETDYSILCMIEQVSRILSGEVQEASVSIQGIGYVDDVIRDSDGIYTYSQLKISAAETWGRDGGKLKEDFQAQVRLCESCGVEDYNMEIVTPHEDRVEHFEANMPRALRPRTRVLLHPSHKPTSWSFSRTSDEPHPALEFLVQLDVSSGASSSALEAIYYEVRTIWERSGTERAAPRDARMVLARLQASQVVNVRDANTALDEEGLTVISSLGIEGLEITVDAGFLRYRYGLEEAIIGKIGTSAIDKFLQRISRKPPADFETFLEELPS